MIFTIIIGVALICICTLRFKLSFIHLILLNLLSVIAALYFVRDTIAPGLIEFFSISAAFYCIGLLSIPRPKYVGVPQLIHFYEVGHPRTYNLALVFPLIMISCLVVYHYYVMEIPLLSEDIEVLRFSQRSSGLLGIPSRLANYAPIVIVIYCALYRNYFRISKSVVYWAILFSVVGLILQGHKSSVLVLVLSLIVAHRFIPSTLREIRYTVVMPAIMLAMVYALAVFHLMETLSGYGVVEYMVERLTTVSVTPLDYAYSGEMKPTLILPSIILHDLIYPFATALGYDVDSINTQLSRDIYGVEPGEFTVPVTPGFIGYFYLEFGKWGTFLASFVVGAFSSLLYRFSELCANVRTKGAAVYFEYVLFLGLTIGNLFYLIPNALIALVLFVLLSIVGEKIKALSISPMRGRAEI